MSRPSRARGLKARRCPFVALSSKSRPSRARGLKGAAVEGVAMNRQSRPSRARGLKVDMHAKLLQHLRRAPRGRVD